MAIHVQDEETDRLVREFARRRGVGITAAIRIAVTEAGRSDAQPTAEFMARIQPVIDRARARKGSTRFDPEDDKRFMDEMWGEVD